MDFIYSANECLIFWSRPIIRGDWQYIKQMTYHGTVVGANTHNFTPGPHKSPMHRHHRPVIFFKVPRQN